MGPQAVLDRLADALRSDVDGRGDDLASMCEECRVELDAAACSVAALDGEVLRYVAASGAGAAEIVGTTLTTDRGIGGYVAQTGQALTIDRPEDDARFARDVAERTGYVPRRLGVLPIVDGRGTVVGILTVLDGRDGETLTSDGLPAWSHRFFGAGPGAAPHLALPGDATRAWAYGDGAGRGVRVAVIDSGIEGDHPLVGDLAGSVAVRRTAGGIEVVDVAADDLYGHGTACAGLIRALAPEAELTSVRVLGPTLRGSAEVFAEALAWCIDRRFDVVNLSLSTSDPDHLLRFARLVEHAAFGRVLLVCAMNNARKVTIPSELAGVCSVACGPGQDPEDVWCNPAGPPEWAAPGLDLAVAWRGGGEVVATGNSFSAAIVSGHLARVVGAHPGITPWQARTVLAAVAANAPTRG